MPLPKVNRPSFFVTLPVKKEKIECVPYMVSDDKLLLMAKESGKVAEIASTTQQIVKRCVVTPDVNVEKLSKSDINYIFMNLRAKSVGEEITMNWVCNNTVPDGSDETRACGHEFEMKINISDVKFNHDKHDLKSHDIKIGNGVGMKLGLPVYDYELNFDETDDDITNTIKMGYACLECVYETENVTPKNEIKLDEFLEWIMNEFPTEQFQKLEDYIETLPYFEINKKHKCEKCGFEHNFNISDEDVLNFF